MVDMGGGGVLNVEVGNFSPVGGTLHCQSVHWAVPIAAQLMALLHCQSVHWVVPIAAQLMALLLGLLVPSPAWC
jgi:hypothetical protein